MFEMFWLIIRQYFPSNCWGFLVTNQQTYIAL